MAPLYQRLLLLFAGATRQELARQLQYLKTENQILRAKLPPRLTITRAERRKLLRFGVPLGSEIRKLISIVTPETFLRWIREEKKEARQAPVQRGRKRTPLAIRRLILRLARENDWGYTRILGELRKLGIKSVSRNTVRNILKQNGFDPGPQRGAGTWDDFLKRHAASLWQCDFFSRRAVTLTGFREVFVLVFLHVESRRAFLSPATCWPNDAWVCEQTREIVAKARASGLKVGQVFHDNDGKFQGRFRKTLSSLRARPKRCVFRSPNTRAHVERFIQTIQKECVDHFVIFGEAHMTHLVNEYVEHYHQERPHQAVGNEPLCAPRRRRRRWGKAEDEPVVPMGEVQCRQRLGGLLRHYFRAA